MNVAHEQAPAVFLDKDGTLIHNVPYSVDPELIELMPRAAEGVSRLCEAGYACVVVSNQSGVARGLFSESDLTAVEQRIRELLAEWSVPLAGFYYCPHHPLGADARYAISCSCRKPQPGMLLQAASALSLDLSRSWLMGDILDDVEAGNHAGCRSVLIDNGHETEWHWNPWRKPTFVAADLAHAARSILKSTRTAAPGMEMSL